MAANSEEIKMQKDVLASIVADIAVFKRVVDVAAEHLKHCPMEHGRIYGNLIHEARSAERVLNMQRREEKSFLIDLIKENNDG